MPTSAEFLAHMRANLPKVEAGIKPDSAPWEGGAASKQKDASEPKPVQAEVYVKDETIAANVAAEPEAGPEAAAPAPVRDGKGRFVPVVANQEPPAAEPADDAAIEIDGEKYDANAIKELATFRNNALRGETAALKAARKANERVAAAEAKLSGIAAKEAELAEREQHVDTLWNAAREKPDLFIQLAHADDGPAKPATPRGPQTQKDQFLTPEALTKVLDEREAKRAASEAAAAKTAAFDKKWQTTLKTLAAGNEVLYEMMYARLAAHNAAGNVTEDHSEQFIDAALAEIHKDATKKLSKHNGVQAHKPAAPVAPPKVPPSPATGGTPLSPKEAPARTAKELASRISAMAAKLGTARPAPARI